MAGAHDFHALEIARIDRETSEAVTLALAIPPGKRETFRFKPGQHVTVRFMLDGAEQRRSYSITSRAGAPDLDITIKRVEGGLVSSHVHRTLRTGDTVDVLPPSGRFGLRPLTEGPRHHVAIAAGSGITPIVGMIEQAMEADPDSRFTLIYGNRTADQVIFRERLEDLKDRYLQRLSVVYVLSRDEDPDVPALAGRIDAAKVRRLLPALIAPAEIGQVYLCGPGTMIKDAREALLAVGVPRERIRFEFFKAGPEPDSPRPRAAAEPTAPLVGAEAVLIIDGTRRTVRVAPGEAIVDAALKAGIAVPYSCKGGMCCTCRSKLIEGRVTMLKNFSLEPWEMDAGFVLACQSVPETDRVVVSFDQM